MKMDVEEITPSFRSFKGEIIIGLCAFFIAYFTAVALKKARSNFPPGPLGLPFVGYLPFLTKYVHLELMDLGKKYGDVFSIKLGAQNFVVLNGADAATEALRKPEFLGRPTNSALQRAFPSSTFFSSNFHLWYEQRKPVVKFIKDLGFGKTKIEEDVMEEINYFLDVLRNSKTHPIDIRKRLSTSLSNNICSLVFGKRYDYDNPQRQYLDKNLEEFFNHFDDTYLDVVFPWIQYIPLVNIFLNCRRSRTAVQNCEIFLKKELAEHLETFNPANARDFMDRYLLEINKQREKHPDTSFNQNMLINNATDLFVAGSETVEATLLWLIYIIAAFPDVQKKVQKEIMEVIGPDKAPEYMDMKNMPYTRAVIWEVMRWKCVGTISLLHNTLAATTVGGYNLEKDTTFIMNLWAIHHDPRKWDEPDEFKPERFLSEDGMSVVKPKYFMPFLEGKRACPGETMSYLEMFLYFTSILQEFDIKFPNETEPTFNGKLDFSYRPEPFLVRFISRK